MSAQDDCELPICFVLTAAVNILATMILGAAGMLVYNGVKKATSDPSAFSDTGHTMEALAIAGSLSYVPMVIVWLLAKKFNTQYSKYLFRAAAFLFLNTGLTAAGCALASKSDDERADFKPVLYFFISAVASFCTYFFYLQQRQIENSHAPYGNENETGKVPQPIAVLQGEFAATAVPIPFPFPGFSVDI